MIAPSLVLLAYVVAAAATRSLTVKVSAPDVVSDLDRFSVLTTIINTGDETLRLLTDPHTPLSPLATNVFVVTHFSGAYPAFNRIKPRYLPEAIARHPEEGLPITVLAPGEAADVLHEVSRYYDFTSSGLGPYTFTPVNVFGVQENDGSVSTLTADTIPATVRFSGKASESKKFRLNSLGNSQFPATNEQFAKQPIFTGCNGGQEKVIKEAVATASHASREVVSYLQDYPRGSLPEKTWFGKWSEERHNQVIVTFERLENDFPDWNYDCEFTCTNQSMAAYILRSEPNRVHLCPRFWDIRLINRAESLIHEGTHFKHILGSEDYEYGQQNCTLLAKNAPDLAVQNADNYAFFASEVAY